MRIQEIVRPSSRTLYHVSPRRNRGSIQRRGLIPQIRRYSNVKRRPGIFLLETLDQARDWAYWESVGSDESWDIWQVDLPDGVSVSADPSREMNETYDSWVVYDPITPERCRLVMTQPTIKRGAGRLDPPVWATKVQRD